MHDETTRLWKNVEDEGGDPIGSDSCSDEDDEQARGFGHYKSIAQHHQINGFVDPYQDEDDERRERYYNLAILALTPMGVKFFKSAQSSFQEYFMTDPELQMSATTYGVLLTLISMPIVPLVGGALLDHRGGLHTSTSSGSLYHAHDEEEDCEDDANHSHTHRNNLVTSLRSITTLTAQNTGGVKLKKSQKASQSNAFCWFLAVALFGIIVYGIGLGELHSIFLGLVGATIFGIGEGCVMVAARAFVGHEFLGGDGAFAQGVLIAMNNLSMLASKNIVPWLIEHATMQPTNTKNNTDDDEVVHENIIRVGILACVFFQFLSLGAGLWYASRFGSLCGETNKDSPQQATALSTPPSPEPPSHKHQQQPQERINSATSLEQIAEEQSFRGGAPTHTAVVSCTPDSTGLSTMTALVNLPLTFWIVATGRAIFLVTFKVFSRYANSFLIEKFEVDAVLAGRKSSVNELFALFSPLVGFLAYRSPGGIIIFALGAGLLGAASIGVLAFFPASSIRNDLPGGSLTPLVGISIAHGIIIPISISLIPHTVPPKQLGMAFAVVEVLGSTLNLTDILFGYLRDTTGDYDVPMQMLFVYALVGSTLLWVSRDRIQSIGIGGTGGG